MMWVMHKAVREYSLITDSRWWNKSFKGLYFKIKPAAAGIAIARIVVIYASDNTLKCATSVPKWVGLNVMI